jgi:hypothetical protein
VTLTTASTYTGRGQANAAQIDRAFAKYGQAIPGLGAAVAELAPIFDFKEEAVAGQISHETGWGTNYWTREHWNIGSIGVTGDSTTVDKTGQPDWQPSTTPLGKVWLKGYHFATPRAGLIALLIHMAYYIYGRDKAKWPAKAQQYHGDAILDPRLPALLSTAWPGTVKYLSDLGNGRFAAAPTGYAAGIVSRGNAILGLPGAIVQTLGVPATTPEFFAWLRAKGIQVIDGPDYVGDGWVGRGGLQPSTIFHHVTDGYSVKGSVGWWRRDDVDGSTQRLIAGPGDPDYPDGTLSIARKDEDQAWGNGVVDHPNLANPIIADWVKRGINPNRVSLSTETSGKPFDPAFPSPKQMQTHLYNDLHWIAKFAIPVDRNHLLRHADVDSVNRPNCPGPRFDLDRLIIDLMAQINAGPTAPRFDSALRLWEAIVDGRIAADEGWIIFTGR